MFKKFLAISAMLFAASSFAAVDANNASADELLALKGIGPVLSKRIVDERSKAGFKDWGDLIARVKGTGGGAAAKLSGEGMTVNGRPFLGVPVAVNNGKSSAPMVVPTKTQNK